MRGDHSAYFALGLRPGAPRSEIDEAYRRLIKLHHPDRNGGDGARASELNRAYTELRREAPRPPRQPVPTSVYRPRRRRVHGRLGGLLVLAVVVVVAGFVAPEGGPLLTDSPEVVPVEWGSGGLRASIAPVPPLGRFDEPLHAEVIQSAIRTAAEFHALEDIQGAIAYSRDCHDRLLSDPSLVLFDACVAFDEATVALAEAGAARDSANFSGSAVTARQSAAARALSKGVAGADSRLHQTRSPVEMEVLPEVDETAAQPAR